MSLFVWCAMRDLNPHGLPLEPKSSASANSANRAHFARVFTYVESPLLFIKKKESLIPSLIWWWLHRESNPGYRRERAVSWPLDHGAIKNRQRPTFPGSFPPSIIGARELNFCVRDGNRCILSAIVTGFTLLNWMSTKAVLSLKPLVKRSTY